GHLAREAEVLERLDHPGIVRYVHHGRTEEGHLFLAMQWLEGSTLGHRLARGNLSVDECRVLAVRLCEALAVAHEHGIVHRDVKPDNVILVDHQLERATL